MTRSVALVSDAEKARAALSPLRRQLLERLRVPGSAASLAGELDLPRQKLNYHLRVLEEAGLVKLVEERMRRGFTERILVTCADTFVVDPALMDHAQERAAESQDRHASEHLLHVAGDIIRDVARMREDADRAGKRLLTLTVEAELAFATPAEFDAFTEELGGAIAQIAKRYTAPASSTSKRRHYRLVAAAHPKARSPRTP